VLVRVSFKLGFDVSIMKAWIRFGAQIAKKNLYIVNLVKDLQIAKVAARVLEDETTLNFVTADSTTEACAYRLAYTTFKEEWFTYLNVGHYELTDKAEKWVSARRPRNYD
jgi:hypothetical protein